MKVIERPMSTTHVQEYMFHLIKDEAEAKNVSNILGDRKPFIVQRSVDMATFQPLLYFAIPNDTKPFSEWSKYVTPLTLMDNFVTLEKK